MFLNLLHVILFKSHRPIRDTSSFEKPIVFSMLNSIESSWNSIGLFYYCPFNFRPILDVRCVRIKSHTQSTREWKLHAKINYVPAAAVRPYCEINYDVMFGDPIKCRPLLWRSLLWKIGHWTTTSTLSVYTELQCKITILEIPWWSRGRIGQLLIHVL